tara:strand:+ start:1324 stop:1902 length:579 start_codon:yes stop_codon:yes gene_type:complete
MAIKTYVLNGSVADQQINKSVDLSFFENVSWVKAEKQPKDAVAGALSWKIDGKAPRAENGATFYKYNNSSAKLYGIWDLSGDFDLKNLPNFTNVVDSGVSGEFIGIVALDENNLNIINGPVFTKNISLENIKIIKDYAKSPKSKYGGVAVSFLGLSGESKSAGFTTIPLAKSKTYKNLCDIILAETIKSYLL